MTMNKKQFIAVVEYFKEYSVFDDEMERENDAQEAASAIDEILRDNADE